MTLRLKCCFAFLSQNSCLCGSTFDIRHTNIQQLLRLVAGPARACVFGLNSLLSKNCRFWTPNCVERTEAQNRRRHGIGAEIPLRRLDFSVASQTIPAVSLESYTPLWELVHL